MCGAIYLEESVAHCDAECEAAKTVRAKAAAVGSHADYRHGVHNDLAALVAAGILSESDVSDLERAFDELPEEDKEDAARLTHMLREYRGDGPSPADVTIDPLDARTA